MSNENMDPKKINIDVEEHDEDDLDEREEMTKTTLEEESSNKDDIDEEPNRAQDEKYQILEDKFIRLQADFMNFKRRTANEKTEYIELGVKKIGMDLLPVLDNFERALENAPEKDSFYDGVKMIMDQLIDVLKKNNIVAMEALGEEFDPNFHHAVLVEPSEEYDSGHVIEVLQKGYLLNEKTLRPAMVKVSE
ncbi:MAG: nucleotide exchange factor GrpE [Tissierellia bacterium]|nr:nucleotide exchange factor GrpE [Tissierellia bacterium]